MTALSPHSDILYFFSGQLRLELAKEKYECSGLVGKAISDGGRKHVKTRYGVFVQTLKVTS